MTARSFRSRWRGIAPLTSGTMSSQEYEAWYDAHAWSPTSASGLTFEDELDAAAWIEPRLLARSYQVGMSAPLGFEAYARIFFPFVGDDIETDGVLIDRKLVSWAETANRNGQVAHALMEQETILAPGQEATCLDELADEQLRVLLPILTRHTASTHSWFLLWDGFGDLNQNVFEQRSKVRHSMREFYLLGGALDTYRNLPHDPNFWWPDDRAWCISTDTDFCWAYVAGSAACIREVLSAAELDAYVTNPDNPARSGMDTTNDPNGTIPRTS